MAGAQMWLCEQRKVMFVTIRRPCRNAGRKIRSTNKTAPHCVNSRGKVHQECKETENMKEFTGFKLKHPELLNDTAFITMVFAEGVPT